MRLENGAFYHFQRNGRIQSGAKVYAQNACSLCHTQLIRPTYAGTEIWRPDWAGNKEHKERGDTRRETNISDYAGEKVAQIGEFRIGPDLSNLGMRAKLYAKEKGISPESWLYSYLSAPRGDFGKYWSKCSIPSSLFQKSEGDRAEVFINQKGEKVIPTDKAKSLVSYLLALEKHCQVPLDFDYKNRKK